MWKAIGPIGLALALAISTASAEGTPPNPKAKMTRELIAKDQSTVQPMTYGYRACSFCYSCGGPWAYLAGTFYTPQPSYTVERGPSCSGSLAYRNDATPYLCCGVDQ